ncbi:unnamed protein product [Periconia digitata]|uniref:Uncharacterized protein n=1 Tax=Periconia digitata TaxID=1303443 RepID=A0A9W4XVD3_9PLEO|nr:unnamed protein product [Periconia digitata]
MIEDSRFVTTVELLAVVVEFVSFRTWLTVCNVCGSTADSSSCGVRGRLQRILI